MDVGSIPHLDLLPKLLLCGWGNDASSPFAGICGFCTCYCSYSTFYAYYLQGSLWVANAYGRPTICFYLLAITVITIGLAVRALLEWLKLNKLTSEQRDELIKLRNEWTVLKGQAKGEDPTSSTPEPARRPEDLHAKETADTKHISPKASDL